MTLLTATIAVAIFSILLLHEATLRWRYQRRVNDRLRRLRNAFALDDQGTILILIALTAAARDWVEANIGKDNGYQPYYPERIIVERRYIQPILDGIEADGLAVEKGS